MSTASLELRAPVRDLARACKLAKTVATPASRCALPALSGVLVSAGTAGARVCATDLETTVVVNLPGAMVDVDGRALVDAAALLGSLARAKGDAGVRVIGATALVDVGATVTLPTLELADLPTAFYPTSVAGTIVDVDVEVLAGVALAAWDDRDALPALSGVHVHGRTLVATDKYRLHLAELPAGPALPAGTLPIRAVRQAVAWARTHKLATVRITVADNPGRGVGYVRASLEAGAATWTCELYCSAFPDYGQLLLADDAPVRWTIADPAALASNLALVGKRVPARATSCARITPTDDGTLACTVAAVGGDEAFGTFTAAGRGGCDDRALVVNPAYLVDVLDGAPAGLELRQEGNAIKQVQARWNVGPVKLTRLLMPVRS